jgi:Terminase large subunit, T4likevirus-type, N-terminal
VSSALSYELSREMMRRASGKWCPHSPTVKQAEFLAATELEVLYGGAAMGGKSDALLMAALQYVDVPGYSGLLLRRTFTDLALPGAIMDRSHQWLRGKACSWDSTRKRWTFPSGATLTFGYLDTAADRYRYQGMEVQFLGVDELTQFEELTYRYMLSRVRRLAGGIVPLRVRAATNPGGIGHDWVKKRFIDGDKPFIPARLEDNPHGDQAAYRDSLAQLDSVTRRQLEDGVWEQDAAGLLYQVPAKCRIYELPEGDWQYIRALDFGIVDANAIAKLGWRKYDRATYVLSAKYFRGGPAAMADELSKDLTPFARTVGDVGGMGKAFQQDIQARKKIPIERADKAAKLGAIRLINDDFEGGLLKVYAPECAELLKEYGSLLRKPDGAEYAGHDNHCADAVLYGWRACPSYLEREKVEPPVVGTPAWQEAEARKVEREVLADEKRSGRRNWLRGMT